ncbi:MAG: nitrate/sulfonate/bicarbonate ABC transporter ATP-binding protein [Deltaproteobacteria bacterium]|nr:nitrate/sulfonate/bicarbonate ABC transporter ATP-binding protein [Deltaproteobacteria bacterium]
MTIKIIEPFSETGSRADLIAEARNISKTYAEESGGARMALQDVSLAISPNEVVCILGPSGCGKSTLLRILVGLIQPSAGTVFSHGRQLHGIHPGASLVFQNFALFPWLTVEDNVRVGLHGRGLSRSEESDLIATTLEKVGLGGVDRAFPKELSGGMKQRVGLARALVGKPELLCLDEPFSALDVMTAEALRSEVYRLWSEGKSGLSSVLLITHLIEEAVFLSDRIVIMDANPGRVRAVVSNDLGHPREYRSREFQDFVDHIHDILTAVHLPDVPVEPRIPHAAVAERITPIPAVTLGQITGMMEILHDHGDEMDLFDLNEFVSNELGQTLTVVKGGELLGLIETPGDLVKLTPEGKHFLQASVAERNDLLASRMKGLGIFRMVLQMLDSAPEGSLEDEEVVAAVAAHLPREPAKQLSDTVCDWGRTVELFDYDAVREVWSKKTLE